MTEKSILEWDYTDLVSSYDKRPDYAPQAIDHLAAAAWRAGARACDIGAGTGRLTESLARRGFRVVAVEPNAAMIGLGVRNTGGLENAEWVQALGETTGLRGGLFDLVGFGSSWNVVDRERALRETVRLLKPAGWLACLYNHRDLDDPVQSRIEARIHEQIPGYRYGVRRRDPAPDIDACGWFGEVQLREAAFVAKFQIEDWLEAWRSHATLRRQAGDRFEIIWEGIRQILKETPRPHLEVPYVTRLWLARKRA